MFGKPLISPEEIERIKKLRAAGAPPPLPADQKTPASVRLREFRRLPPRDEDFDEKQIQRMNGRETSGILALGGCNALLDDNVPAGLKQRMQRMRIWWRYRGAVRQLQRVQDLLEQSCEDDQRMTLAMRVRHLNVHIGMDRVHDPEGMWVRIPDLNIVCQTVLEDTCGLCMKDEKEALACPLRQALRAMTTLTEDAGGKGKNGCIYKKLNVMEGWEDDEE